jgi:hypothetical protein
MNLRVNLTKRINTLEGFCYSPVVMSDNGRVKPGAVKDAVKADVHIRPSSTVDGSFTYTKTRSA